MSGNVHRFTASRILFVFAAALFLVSLLSLQIRLKRAQLEWVEYPTALGDVDLYDPAKPIGKNDFFEPNLRFAEHPEGVYRRNHKPREKRDEDMLAVARDVSGSYTIYTPRDRDATRTQPAEKDGRRYFLKVGDDRYIEFGERRYWPEFDPEDVGEDKAGQELGR